MATYNTKNSYVVAQVIVDPRGVDPLFVALTRNLDQLNLAAFLDDTMDPFIRARIANRFQSEGDDVTGAWLPLARTTEAIRTAKGFPPAHPINQRTHMMRDWLVETPSSVKVIGAEVVITNPGTQPSGLMHQKIQTAQAGKTVPGTPPRPVMGLSQADDLYLQNALVNYLLSGA